MPDAIMYQAFFVQRLLMYSLNSICITTFLNNLLIQKSIYTLSNKYYW